MTATLHAGADLAQPASYDLALHCVAGFFASEPQAQAVAQQLRQAHGLQADQGLLLGPDQASWLSFARQARRWAYARHTEGRTGLSDAWLMAGFGAIGVALVMLIGVALEGAPNDRLEMLLLAGPVLGAATGWLASALTSNPVQQRRFNRHIRNQLAAGGWVVLAHHMPLPQQAGAAAMLREQGIGWCAMYAPWRLL